MRTPLDFMICRTADLDRVVGLSSVTSRLNKAASPIGGTYGKVRSSGTQMHHGWDLYARIGTPCYAISTGEVVSTAVHTGYGRCVMLKLQGLEANALAQRYSIPAVFALYAHLSAALVGPSSVMEGAKLALSGAGGNAFNTPPHLHFELRKTHQFGVSNATIDPAELFGSHYLASHADDVTRVKQIFGLQ